MSRRRRRNDRRTVNAAPGKTVATALEGAPQYEPFPFVTKVIELFGDWLAHQRELNELTGSAADPGELERVVRELNAASAGLEMLTRQGAEGANELPYMLTALGIDEMALWREEPALLRDMVRVCSLCRHKRRCHQELAAGTAAMNYVEYCENSETIDTLRFKT